jgi:hypothetical protein
VRDSDDNSVCSYSRWFAISSIEVNAVMPFQNDLAGISINAYAKADGVGIILS